MAHRALDSWEGFPAREPGNVRFGGNCAGLYLEAEAPDAPLKTPWAFPEVERPPLERRWGVYGPDRHAAEAGEAMRRVCRRFSDSGLGEEGVADGWRQRGIRPAQLKKA